MALPLALGEGEERANQWAYVLLDIPSEIYLTSTRSKQQITWT